MKAAKNICALIILLFALAINAHAWSVPDTGQTKCYNNTAEIPCPAPGEAFYGQDGSYSINTPSYTKLNANGNALSDDATAWAMVRDNVTGLIWENKTNDATIHDESKHFTWCDTNPTTNGGSDGICGTGKGDAATDTEAFIKALNDSKFGGFSDWRMPFPYELATIENLARRDPAIDTTWFLNMLSSYYWSSSISAYYTNLSWSVDSDYGTVSYNGKAPGAAIRAVRNEPTGTMMNNRLLLNGDGTVTDTTTGLMWQQGDVPNKTWQEALAYAEGLSLADYDDWRLPTKKELQTIVNYSRHSPAVDMTIFPSTLSSGYWSSTTTSVYSGGYAWYIDFNHGIVSYDNKTDAYAVYAVRTVRGGQNRIPGNVVITEPRQADWIMINGLKSIVWDAAGLPGNVKITLSRQGGKAGTFTEIIANSVPNNGSYSWMVTGPASSNCVLKIESLTDLTKTASQGLFSIVPSYNLTVQKTGSAVITSVPSGINCGTVCTAAYASGTSVTLNAVADFGSTFSGWSEDSCSGKEICTVTMDTNKTISAIFTLNDYTITASAGANGTISPSVSVKHGSYSVFTIIPEMRYHVADILVDGISVGPMTTFTFNNVTANHTITASFILEGDVDMSGDVGLTDVILALQILSSSPTIVPVHKEADVDGDKKIGIAEAINAMQCIARLRNNHSPVLASIGNKSVDENSNLTFTLSATDEDNDPMTFSASHLPSGATFHANAKTFSWTPTYSQSGTYPVTFTVRDDYGGTASETVTITVNEIPVFGATDYFPLNVGDWHEYISAGIVSRTTVSGTKSIGGYNAMIRSSSNGNSSYYSSDQNGVKYYGEYSASNGSETLFDTPLLMMSDNAIIGTSSSSTSKYSFVYSGYTYNVNVTSTTKILGLEDVQTANRTLKDCLKVSQKIDQYIVETGQSIPGVTAYYWFYESVGSVKTVVGSDTQIISGSYINGVEQTY